MRNSIECGVCGRAVPVKRTGRPPEYCGRLCRKFREHQRKLASIAYAVQFTRTAALKERATIWEIGNDCHHAIDHDARKRWGRALQKARRSRGWSQFYAATLAGIARRRWGHLECGSRPASPGELRALVVLDFAPGSC